MSSVTATVLPHRFIRKYARRRRYRRDRSRAARKIFAIRRARPENLRVTSTCFCSALTHAYDLLWNRVTHRLLTLATNRTFVTNGLKALRHSPDRCRLWTVAPDAR